MAIFKNTEYPKKSKDLKGNEEDFSVDVITHDKQWNAKYRLLEL